MNLQDKLIRICAWINFGVQFWISGYMIGIHRYFWFGGFSALFAAVSAFFIMKRTAPKLTIVTSNKPITLPKRMVIIDAEFEEV